MEHYYNKQKTPAVWDYDIKSLDFSDPEVMRWYLTRRIENADWQGLKKNDIKQYLSYLKNSPGLKLLLAAVVMQLTNLQNSALHAISQSSLVDHFYWTGGTAPFSSISQTPP